MDLEHLLQLHHAPRTVARRAFHIARNWIPDEILRHSVRAWVLAEQLATREGITRYDREVLFVAAMLHDLALHDPFDAHVADFEVASGAMGSVVATALGWEAPRSRRVAEVIEAHMRDTPDPARDPEGYLVEAATAADVSGRGLERWDADALRTLDAQAPRGSFAECFSAAIAGQAARTPASAAAALNASGRIRSGEQLWQQLVHAERTERMCCSAPQAPVVGGGGAQAPRECGPQPCGGAVAGSCGHLIDGEVADLE